MAKKIVGTIAKAISSAIYVMIIVGIIITLLPMLVGYKPIVVLSGSMEPTYPVGSLIYYKATDFANIAQGDAITFEIGDGALATHRVTQKDEEGQEFVTKGDNNPTEDVSPVQYEAVVGKTGDIAIPYVGFLGKYIRQMPVMLVLGLLFVLCTILSPEKRDKENVCKEENNC